MINKVILVGRVGVDPEFKALADGSKVARVKLATSEKVYNRESNTSQEYTEWHTITLWSNLADIVDKWVKKGDLLYIEGTLRTREYTDREGVKRYTTEVVARELKMLGGNRQQTATPQPEAQPTPEVAPIPTDPDGLPF